MSKLQKIFGSSGSLTVQKTLWQLIFHDSLTLWLKTIAAHNGPNYVFSTQERELAKPGLRKKDHRSSNV